MTVAAEIANYAIGFDSQELSQDVVHAAKRVLLDTLGCAIGGYASDASKIAQNVVSELGLSNESTIIGSGVTTNCINASLVNGIMTRYLDYMDQITIPVGNSYVYAHPSEIIPGILALAERQHLSGIEVLRAIILGYELSARFAAGTTIVPMAKKGWAPDTLGVYVMPVIAGKILGLNHEQIENAIGISGSHGMVLGILDTEKEENTMTKNMRYPSTACGGIMAALLAKKGFSGPTTVIEGENGFIQSVMGGDFNLEKLTGLGNRLSILDTECKAWSCAGAIQGHLNATLNLVKEHDLQLEDVSRVRIWAGTRSVRHTGDQAKRYPKNKETADHSAHYVTAVAIKEGALGPAQYASEKYNDPVIMDLIGKISIEIDTSLDQLGRAGITEITTRQGFIHRCRVDYPKGHPNNPMTDEEINDKFRAMAYAFMSEQETKRVVDTIYNLDTLNDIGILMKRLVFTDR